MHAQPGMNLRCGRSRSSWLQWLPNWKRPRFHAQNLRKHALCHFYPVNLGIKGSGKPKTHTYPVAEPLDQITWGSFIRFSPWVCSLISGRTSGRGRVTRPALHPRSRQPRRHSPHPAQEATTPTTSHSQSRQMHPGGHRRISEALQIPKKALKACKEARGSDEI